MSSETETEVPKDDIDAKDAKEALDLLEAESKEFDKVS